MDLAACATAESPDRTDVVLLRAHITSIDVGESLDQGTGEVMLGTRNTVAAVASEILIGRMASRDFSIVLPMTSVPRLGGSLDEIFILAQVVEGGGCERFDGTLRRRACALTKIRRERWISKKRFPV